MVVSKSSFSSLFSYFSSSMVSCRSRFSFSSSLVLFRCPLFNICICFSSSSFFLIKGSFSVVDNSSWFWSALFSDLSVFSSFLCLVCKSVFSFFSFSISLSYSILLLLEISISFSKDLIFRFNSDFSL